MTTKSTETSAADYLVLLPDMRTEDGRLFLPKGANDDLHPTTLRCGGGGEDMSKYPWRQHDWQKHCLIIPSEAGPGCHVVLYAPGTPDQRTLFNSSGWPKWGEGKGGEGPGVLYALPWWDSEEDALAALAKVNKPD